MIGQKGIPATYGGIERHVEELARRLAHRGVGCGVYCRPHYTPASASVPDVDLLRRPSVNTKHPDAISHAFACTADSMLARADVVHYHALGPSALAWLPRMTGKRVVVTVHGLDWQRDKWGRLARGFLHACEFSATRFPHATIVVSRTLERYFRSQGRERIHYIPNGTPIPPPASSAPLADLGLEPGRYVLFVGRLVPEKGLDLLLRAHAAAVPEWPLAVVGAGHFTDDYVERCRRLAAPSARFLDGRYGEELAALQQHAAVVVVPSLLEGLSIALLEAMSYGRPVLASDIPENLEVLADAGVSFRNQDPEDLGFRLRELLASAERREELGGRARARIAAEYDWERVADSTLELYRRL